MSRFNFYAINMLRPLSDKGQSVDEMSKGALHDLIHGRGFLSARQQSATVAIGRLDSTSIMN